jgi:hypothetical protein
MSKIADFISQQTESEADRNKRTKDRIEWWTKRVQNLFETIRPWFPSHNARIEDHAVYEQRSGAYRTKKFVVRVGGQVINFVPKGTYLIGAAGRVDIVGPRGERRLILNDSSDAAEWQVVLDPANKTTMVPLSEDTLLEALKLVLSPAA